MSQIKDRLLEFISKNDLTVSEFERRSGLSNGAVSKTNNNIRKTTLKSIALAFPNLNMDWLVNGNGEMVISTINPSEEVQGNNDFVPLLPVEAMAGTLQGISEGVELATCRKIKSPVKGADWAIQISGDSMEPEFKNGGFLFIKKMTGTFIPWGHTMVLDTYDGVIVKDIYPVNDNDALIEAKSINPKYPPFKVEKSLVIGLYRVLGYTYINSTI